MTNVLFTIKKIWVFFSTYFSKTYTANICGHKTKLERVEIHNDQAVITNIPLADNGSPDYCIDCINDMAIMCAWCGGQIKIGNPITLYTPHDFFETANYAVSYNEGGSKALVGCMRGDCAGDVGDRAGFWLPGDDGKGMVFRVPTAFEALIKNPDASAVFISDTESPTVFCK